MIYHIDPKKKKRNTAGAKAPEDINELCNRRGYSSVDFTQFPVGKSKLYQRIWVQIVGNRDWNRLYKKVSSGDTVIFQHPSYGKRTTLKWVKRIRSKGCRMIALIHDLESLRGGIIGLIKTNRTTEIGDRELLMAFDKVICHNEHMKKYLVEQGFDADKLVSLEIFDYLSECKPLDLKKGIIPSIAIAGNLAIGKSGYIYKVFDNESNEGLIVNLFGIRFEQDKASSRLVYHGSFRPEELPEHLVGNFGLVWDGPEAYTCSGNTGEYLRYNNPHKTSLYLSSGMPVIVWTQAAITDFVLENGVGIAVDSLFELEDRIRNVSEKEYQSMCQKAKIVSEQLHGGYYFYKAVDACL